jgi:glyoxylase-like metal-dependent hydrolase (beta-lactamase superfamily II)
MKPTNAMLAAAAVAMCGCQWIERRAINGSIESAFHEINTPGTGVTKLADDLYTYKWFGYRTAFLTTPEGVIVFDPLNADAATQLAAEIRKVAPNPTIRYVIYSHNHADHIEGAARLGGTPVIVSHAIAARQIAARPDPEIVAPTETFGEDRKDITLGGVTVQLHHVPGAHTEGLIAAYIPHRKTLYAVDIVAVHMIPPFGSPFNSYHGVVAALRKLQQLDFQTLIPAHGPTGTKTDLTAWLTMLADMKTSLDTAAKANGMAPMRGNPKAIEHPKVGQVLFAALDDLAPKYRHWQGWDHNALQALQWVYLYGIYMNE